MEIKVFGSGCRRCEQTVDIVKTAVTEMGIDANIIKVTNMAEIAKSGIMSTPAVMVDGVIKSTGAIPLLNDIKDWLSAK